DLRPIDLQMGRQGPFTTRHGGTSPVDESAANLTPISQLRKRLMANGSFTISDTYGIWSFVCH
ncbi:MAG: hypothetical protein RIG67_14895, partial [Rhodospirillales bacterium]